MKMNEVNQAIILAAGRSRRMEHLSKKLPKCLLQYKEEIILKRLVRQIENSGVEKIVITIGYRADAMHKIFDSDNRVTLVENKMYEEDVNIKSMALALSKVDNGAVAIFEADTVMEDSLVSYVLGSDFEGKSVWFTRGSFNETQYGGILKTDKFGNINDIKIVPAWSDKYKKYSKLSGLMRVSANEIELFRALVNKYARTTLKQYFLNAWIENIKLLPCIEADISNYSFFTFNKPEEYYQIQNSDIDIMEETPKIEMISIAELKHIEEYDKERMEILISKIEAEKMWTRPIIVESKKGIILDGQHRFEAAKKMGLKNIPAIIVDYDDVFVWTLRKEYRVSQALVYRKINSGKVYPYKTVKHKFKFTVPDIKYNLDDLRG